MNLAEFNVACFYKKAQLSLGKTRYSLYSFCCTTDLQGYPRSMIFVIWKPLCDFLLVIKVTLATSLTISDIWPLTAWNFPLKIAAKPLQMETWLRLTAYRKSPAPYPMVPSPTLYNLLFSHCTTWFAYHSALWPFKVIQGQWFSCHLKANMRLPISSQ